VVLCAPPAVILKDTDHNGDISMFGTKHLVTALVVLTLAGCATPLPRGSSSPTISSGKVSYGDSKAVEALTNEFGSTDLQTIAESMTRSLLGSAVIQQGNRPRLTLADVKNKTSEYIDTGSITKSIRSQLTKSGAVKFVASIDEMQTQTDELVRQNQSGLYDRKSTKKIGKMRGADFRLEGEITSIVKRSGDIKDVYYKFSLQMVDVETGEIEWADEKEIRKTSRR
jgi:hypothetical protein